MKKRYLAATFIMMTLLTPLATLAEESSNENIKAYEAMFPKTDLSEDDVYRADRLLVSATGSLKPIHLAPSVASVITAEEIKKMGATSLDEILETVPGLHVAPSGLNIFSSIWSIRGIHTSMNPQVLLLLNGIPLTDVADGGRFHRFNMPVAMISRVEVVRGPGSAVHGADAFSGTINVITKDGHEVAGTESGIRYGSFDSVDLWLQHGADYSGWDIVSGVEVRKTDGDSNRTINQDRLGSGSPSLTPGALDTSAQQVDLNIAMNKDDHWVGRFYGSWVDETGMGAGAIQALNGDESVIKNTQYLVDLEYNNEDLISGLDLSLRGTYLYQNSENHFQFFPSNEINMIGEPRVTIHTTGLETVGNYGNIVDHALRFSLGVKYYSMDTDEFKNFGPGISTQFGRLESVKGTPYIFMDNQTRFLWYLSAQDEWAFAKGWEFTAGIRYDNYDDFGSTINPRIALVWETRYDLTSKLMYGRAFRAPSFSEQYIQGNPVNRGNASIEPETIDTYELAFDWQPTKYLRVVPSFFYYEIKGMIAFIGTLPSQAENYTAQQGHGFEVEANWQVFESLYLKGNVSYQRSKDKETNQLIADTPEWQFYTEANWSFLPEWDLNGQWFWVGEQPRAEGDPRDDTGDYNSVNLTLRRENIAKHWDLALSARNVFDQDVREPSPYDQTTPAGSLIPEDYPMEGRSVWAEIRFRF